MPKLYERINDDRGFTLTELIVVILIIGILAAIALAALSGQRGQGQDASAKSDARNLVSLIQSCEADTGAYTSCDSVASLGTTGLDIGAPGALPTTAKVAVTASSSNSYTVVANSRSGNYFSMSRSGTGLVSRRCGTTMTTAGAGSGLDRGGCRDNAW